MFKKSDMNLFFIVLGRNQNYVKEKIDELEGYEVPYRVIWGEKWNTQISFRGNFKGKWDTVNYSRKVISKGTDVVVFNDVDTTN